VERPTDAQTHAAMPVQSLALSTLSRFYGDTRRDALRTAHRLLRDWPAAEEVTCEAFAALHARLGGGGRVLSPAAYVLSRIHRQCIARLVRARKAAADVAPNAA
jgi:DNA-directed RNA polymerase specialized sigma24 family protein